jgi:hypothetical protein
MRSINRIRKIHMILWFDLTPHALKWFKSEKCGMKIFIYLTFHLNLMISFWKKSIHILRFPLISDVFLIYGQMQAHNQSRRSTQNNFHFKNFFWNLWEISLFRSIILQNKCSLNDHIASEWFIHFYFNFCILPEVKSWSSL